MNFPSDLTDLLLEFVLDNHGTIRVCATSDQAALRGEERQSLRTGIEDILVDELDPPTITAPAPRPDPTAVAETVDAIWNFVLDSYDDNVWLDKDERIVFFARWETAFKLETTDRVTTLLETL